MFRDVIYARAYFNDVNKPRLTVKKFVNCIDHIYINSFYNQDTSAGIIKTDISDHFSIFIIDNDNPRKLLKAIRIINDSRLLTFKTELSPINYQSVDTSYHTFLLFTIHTLRLRKF